MRTKNTKAGGRTVVADVQEIRVVTAAVQIFEDWASLTKSTGELINSICDLREEAQRMARSNPRWQNNSGGEHESA